MSEDYALLDFGDGRKLERFGPFILDRPCPAAEGSRRVDPEAWRAANARFELSGEQRGGQRGHWLPARALPESWTIAIDALQFEIKPTDFGHVGLFPEQFTNWRWIAERVKETTNSTTRPKILNLFAYTGGSTLAAAAAGAEVVHVDSSRAAVSWARRNAELSGLSAAPTRWIVEDAPRFVRRELARGNRYDGIILDPPSYGHGPAGETWKLEDNLPALLSDCAALVAHQCSWLLLTCHSPAISPARAVDLLQSCSSSSRGLTEHLGGVELKIETSARGALSSGVAAWRYVVQP